MEILDRFTDWFEGHWRCAVYSFLAGALFTILVSCATAA